MKFVIFGTDWRGRLGVTYRTALAQAMRLKVGNHTGKYPVIRKYKFYIYVFM